MVASEFYQRWILQLWILGKHPLFVDLLGGLAIGLPLIPESALVISLLHELWVYFDHVLLGCLLKQRFLLCGALRENISGELTFVIEAVGD